MKKAHFINTAYQRNHAPAVHHTTDHETTDHHEGEITKKIEKQTSRIPSDVFLWSAAGAFSFALLLKAKKKDHTSLLVGQLISPLLLLGIYNKIVKIAGHDHNDKQPG